MKHGFLSKLFTSCGGVSAIYLSKTPNGAEGGRMGAHSFALAQGLKRKFHERVWPSV